MSKLLLAVLAVAILIATPILLHKLEPEIKQAVKFAVNEAEQYHEVPIEAVEMFQQWKVQYGVQYSGVQEEAYRMGVFFANYLLIKAHDPKIFGYSVALNQFADLTHQEFVAIYLGTNPALAQSSDPNMVEQDDSQMPQAPTSVNWVQQGKVGAVRNQGSCGSCWAFSATGALTSDDAIFGSGLVQFSPQQLVDCSSAFGNQGCNGGWMDQAFDYVIKYGIATAQQYPYTGVQGSCKMNGGSFKIKSYTDIAANNCNSLQNGVARQPTSVAVDATNWQFYSTGVFSNCGVRVNHGVVAVGYNQGSYWYVQNSWGATWGQSGYIQLKWGNTCAICSTASYPNI